MTALTERAAFAWAELSRKYNILDAITGRTNMPPGVALDYVQGDDYNRDDAVTAILEAASNALGAKKPRDVSGIDALAESVLSDLRGEAFGLAVIFLDQISHRADDVGTSTLAGMYGPRGTPDRPDVSDCDLWRVWANDAREAIALCKQVVAAAYPVES